MVGPSHVPCRTAGARPAPPGPDASQMSYSYQTSKVHTANWHEEAQWRDSTGQRPAASLGARRFGQATDLTEAQALARTNGHDTRSLTSWGDDAGRFDTSRNYDSSRPSRRGMVAPPNETANIKHALAGLCNV